MNDKNKKFTHNKAHGGPPGMMAEKPKDFKGTLHKLLLSLSRYKLQFIIVLIFAIGATVFSIIGPKILGNATTELYTGLMSKLGGGTGINFTVIHRILLWLLTLYVISAVFNFVEGFMLSGITQRMAFDFRKQLSEKINRLPMSYFDKRQTGEVLSVITNDVDTLSSGFSQSATQLVTSVISLIGVLIMMLTIDWVMTLITLLIVPVSILLISVVVKHSQKYFKQQQDFLGNVNGQVEEAFGGVSVIQAFNNEEAVIAEFEKVNNGLYKSGWKSGFISGLMMPIMNFIGNISYVAVAVVGGYFAATGRITVGNIQSFIQYSRNFTQPLSQISQVSNMLQSMMAAAERIFVFLEENEEEQQAEAHCLQNGEKVQPLSLKGAVEFRHVCFGYDPEKPIIKDFSAIIKQGQKIAVVGPTGAGKTTIVKLLMRFYDISAGEILIDGYNIESFDRSELRELFGMVLQDAWLFTGTIAENIRYGRLEAGDTEVVQAAEAAHVHHFIKTLPEGYQMQLRDDAANVSQGQKQLLTIARAILADNKILILDEATSSVDTRTEELIQKAMDNLMRGRTSFVIAHRLSTIRDADLVLVMNDGDIVEQGTHDELLAKNGFYAKMYNSQFESVTA